MSPLGLTLVAAIVGLLAVPGCKAFDETLLVDAGSECTPAAPPERPSTGGEGAERLYVLRDVEIEQGGDWRTIGWDRDGLCTEMPEYVTECRPPIEEDGIEEDGASGIDNVFGHEVVQVATIFGTALQSPFRAHQELGLGTTLVLVRGYDGEPDDDRVDVTIAPGAFGSPPDMSGGVPVLPPDGMLPPPPRWDGADFFWADELAFVDANEDAPRIRDDNAYVRDGVLVVRPPDRSSLFLTADAFSLEMIIGDAVLTARIAEGGLEDVVLSWRWRGSDLLSALNELGFCPGTTSFDRMARLLEIQADLRAVPGSGGEGTTCDALSAGLRFRGAPARWAGLAPAPERVDGCE